MNVSEARDLTVIVGDSKPVVWNNSQSNVPHTPVPWGKLTKNILQDVFQDVHRRLGTLGPPSHISMSPNVIPVQTNPHRCPVAKEAKVAGPIRDLEKQGISKKIIEPSMFTEKNRMVGVYIVSSQTINKAIEVPKTLFQLLMNSCQS